MSSSKNAKKTQERRSYRNTPEEVRAEVERYSAACPVYKSVLASIREFLAARDNRHSGSVFDS